MELGTNIHLFFFIYLFMSYRIYECGAPSIFPMQNRETKFILFSDKSVEIFPFFYSSKLETISVLPFWRKVF